MKLATLLYIRNQAGDFLLMERRKNPNMGLMSPPGGKVITEEAEPPDSCAVREAYEECGLESKRSDWRLRGIVTEKNFPDAGNILIFLMEYKHQIRSLPDACNEGTFYFINQHDFDRVNMPVTDRKFIWKEILENNDMFILSLDCTNYPDIVIMQ